MEVLLIALAATTLIQCGYFLWKISADDDQPKFGEASMAAVVRALISDWRWVLGLALTDRRVAPVHTGNGHRRYQPRAAIDVCRRLAADHPCSHIPQRAPQASGVGRSPLDAIGRMCPGAGVEPYRRCHLRWDAPCASHRWRGRVSCEHADLAPPKEAVGSDPGSVRRALFWLRHGIDQGHDFRGHGRDIPDPALVDCVKPAVAAHSAGRCARFDCTASGRFSAAARH